MYIQDTNIEKKICFPFFLKIVDVLCGLKSLVLRRDKVPFNGAVTICLSDIGLLRLGIELPTSRLYLMYKNTWLMPALCVCIIKIVSF